ncbi:hypothetical protein MIS45_07730 [Wielerella bovis]|uniref:hypothetical protein n=1 Tax=Wielerella bovis TaxID=2917790 RepID=UPI002019CBFF|nr:hypothetical protein [Wielerella bovis]ULJ68677.1 hypothetical protein MIS45_07730 [Wielerella bovis]
MKKFLAALVGISALLLGGCSVLGALGNIGEKKIINVNVYAYNHTDKIINFSYSPVPKGPPPSDMSKSIPLLGGGGGWSAGISPYAYASNLNFAVPRQYDPNFALLVQWYNNETYPQITLTKVGVLPYPDDADGYLSLHFMPDGSIKGFYGLDAENPYRDDYRTRKAQFQKGKNNE